MAELKTKLNNQSVSKFLNAIADEQKRKDCIAISKLIQDATGYEPKMWGDAIVGFGSYHYKYESGREGDFLLTGFSPRKANITVYAHCGLPKQEPMLKKLGKFKTSKSCIYIKQLKDVDTTVLKEIVVNAVEYMKNHKWSD